MSALLIGKVLANTELKPAPKLVLVALADEARDDGTNCYPGLSRIARKATQSVRSVQRTLLAFQACGYVQVQYREGPHLTNRYHLNVQAIEENRPFRIDARPDAGGDSLSSGDNPEVVTNSSSGGDKLALGGDTAMSPNPLINPLDNTREILSSAPTDIASPPKPKTNSKQPKISNYQYTADDMRLVDWMAGKIREVVPAARMPSNMGKWANEIRLMRTREIDPDDKARRLTLREIAEMFAWANKHHFWCRNILSPETLWRQWNKLSAQRIEVQVSGGTQRTGSLSEQRAQRKPSAGFIQGLAKNLGATATDPVQSSPG